MNIPFHSWWDPAGMFSDSAFTTLLAIVIGILLVAPLAIAFFRLAGKLSPEDSQELTARYRSWLLLASVIILPMALGPATTILSIGALSILCYREFARVTGLFRARRLSVVITIGTLALVLAALYGSYPLFIGLSILTLPVIAATSITSEHEMGYLQRTALAVFGWILIVWLSHLGLLTARPDYRAVLLWLVLCVELNDVFAYLFGRAIGGRKLCPQVSPKKTASGSFGALFATTLLAIFSGLAVFAGDPVGTPLGLLTLGVIISSTGQLGDLMLSAIKRDIGVKDTSTLIPGHGGLLDRFDSLLLAGPIVFYVLRFANGGLLS